MTFEKRRTSNATSRRNLLLLFLLPSRPGGPELECLIKCYLNVTGNSANYPEENVLFCM
jgi:hypothetical protein